MFSRYGFCPLASPRLFSAFSATPPLTSIPWPAKPSRERPRQPLQEKEGQRTWRPGASSRLRLSRPLRQCVTASDWGCGVTLPSEPVKHRSPWSDIEGRTEFHRTRRKEQYSPEGEDQTALQRRGLAGHAVSVTGLCALGRQNSQPREPAPRSGQRDKVATGPLSSLSPRASLSTP